MRLALETGWPNYEAMLATMEPQHIDRWERYYRQEPFGRQWHMMSALAVGVSNEIKIVANSLGMKSELFKEDDFVPKFKEAPQKMSIAAGFAGLRAQTGV